MFLIVGEERKRGKREEGSLLLPLDSLLKERGQDRTFWKNRYLSSDKRGEGEGGKRGVRKQRHAMQCILICAGDREGTWRP